MLLTPRRPPKRVSLRELEVEVAVRRLTLTEDTEEAQTEAEPLLVTFLGATPS